MEQNLASTNLDLVKSTVSGEETLESQGLDKEAPDNLVIMDWNNLGLGVAGYNRLQSVFVIGMRKKVMKIFFKIRKSGWTWDR